MLLCHIMHALSMATQIENFIAYKWIGLMVQLPNFLLKTLPLRLRVQGSFMGVEIVFPVFEPEIGGNLPTLSET